jgi:hypothetical protein
MAPERAGRRRGAPAPLAFLLLALISGACQRESPRAPEAKPAPTAAAAFVAEGDAFLARGDHAAAAAKFEQAVALAPRNIAARYGLGTALSHLDRTDEAVVQFQWVVRLGGSRSPLAATAREWLTRRRAMPTPGQSRVEYTPPDQREPGRVRSRLSWSGILGGGDTPVELELRRSNFPHAPLPYEATARVPGPYEFPRVAPGHYRLTAWTKNPRVELWREFVVVQPGEDIDVNLTAGNAVAPPDALPLPDPRILRERERKAERGRIDGERAGGR